MKPETKFKNKILRWLKQLRAEYQWRIWWVKLNDRTTEGLPDLLVIVNGEVFFIELKVWPNKPTPLQENTIKKIISARGNAFFLYEENFENFIKPLFLKILKE